MVQLSQLAQQVRGARRADEVVRAGQRRARREQHAELSARAHQPRAQRHAEGLQRRGALRALGTWGHVVVDR